jgi:hypothetical protein
VVASRVGAEHARSFVGAPTLVPGVDIWEAITSGAMISDTATLEIKRPLFDIIESS